MLRPLLLHRWLLAVLVMLLAVLGTAAPARGQAADQPASGEADESDPPDELAAPDETMTSAAPDETTGTAGTGDYDTGSTAWNGLGTLTAVARGLGLAVHAVPHIDWSEMRPTDILFVLYPEARLDPAPLVGFIRNGGQVLIADDFGDSTEVLGRLGMLREPASGIHAPRFYNGLDHAPVAVPALPGHALAEGVSELATNVPGVLVRVSGVDVVFRFGLEEAVVVTAGLGRGRFVVLSDPSVLINRMLQFEGNLRFAINVLRFLSREGRARRLVLLTGDFRVYGEPPEMAPDNSVQSAVSGATSDVNRWLDEGNDYLLTEVALRVVGVLLAALVAFLALLLVPSLRNDSLDGAWTRPPAPETAEVEGFEKIVARYDRSQRDTSFMLPAAVLRDTVNAILARVLGTPDPLYNADEQELLRTVREQCGATAAEALQRVIKRLQELPSRVQAASQWGAGYLSRRDFEQLHRDIDRLYLAIGQDPDLS